jgi:hypothetical protein
VTIHRATECKEKCVEDNELKITSDDEVAGPL